MTRQPDAPNLDVLAEGGSNYERRFGVSGGGQLLGFGVAVSASRTDDNGPVANSDYRNENLMLNVTRRFGRQSLTLHGDFDSNSVGEPGPWGSDPQAHLHRHRHRQPQQEQFRRLPGCTTRPIFRSRVREDLSGAFFLNNNGYTSPYGFSFNKDLRGAGRSAHHRQRDAPLHGGLRRRARREEVKNTYITDAGFSTFPIRRNDMAVLRGEPLRDWRRLFLNAGVRGEFIRTGVDPRRRLFAAVLSRRRPSARPIPNCPRPTRPARHAPARLRSAPASGRPAASTWPITNNPALKPERTRSFDAGIEQRLLRDRLSLDATYFYNRYYDLIVTLGGSI